MDELRVEVFPLDVARWIAVIETDDGPFSTEAPTAGAVPTEIAAAIREVLGRDVPFTAVDARGRPWSPEAAERAFPGERAPARLGPGGDRVGRPPRQEERDDGPTHR